MLFLISVTKEHCYDWLKENQSNYTHVRQAFWSFSLLLNAFRFFFIFYFLGYYILTNHRNNTFWPIVHFNVSSIWLKQHIIQFQIINLYRRGLASTFLLSVFSFSGEFICRIVIPSLYWLQLLRGWSIHRPLHKLRQTIKSENTVR